ncbi:MAG TPA: hypothetical protein VH044_04590 [Polyangiaceae bacterium]|nr:hypothetical protein [Polyangiaceae bacterium]
MAVCLSAALVTTTSAIGPARADGSPREPAPDDTAEACFAAAERAQPLLRQKKLREARALLEACARDVCPRVARSDCREWLAEATDAQSSIVIAAHEVVGTAAPRDVGGLRAVIDDALVVDHVDATPIVVDPGRHRLRLERAGAAPLVQEIEVREGEKARVVDVYWRSADVVMPTRPVPASVYVTGVLGLVAVGVGAYFEASGLSRRHDLDACQPTCPQSQVNSARTQTGVGDVTIGGGLLLLTSALVLYLTRPIVDVSARKDQTAWTLGVTPEGFYVGARGTL